LRKNQKIGRSWTTKTKPTGNSYKQKDKKQQKKTKDKKNFL